MKTKHLLEHLRLQNGERIAGHGYAELVKHVDGHYELRGGTAEDQRALKEWISRFMTGIKFTCRPPTTGQTTNSPQS